MNLARAGGSAVLCAAGTTLLLLVWILGLMIVSHHNPFAGADVAVWEWFVEHRSGGTTAAVSALTIMFSPVWVSICAGIIAVRDRSALRATQVVVTVALAGAMCEILKVAVARARPPVAQQVGGTELSLSFPSGHVSGFTALALGLAVAVTADCTVIRRVAAITAALAEGLVAATTRLYLGVHWLSDVTAAIALAAGIAAVAPAATARALTQLGPHLPERLRDFTDPTRTLDHHDQEPTQCTATH